MSSFMWTWSSSSINRTVILATISSFFIPVKVNLQTKMNSMKLEESLDLNEKLGFQSDI